MGPVGADEKDMPAPTGFWRQFAFVFRRVRAHSVPREPATGFLSGEERWRPRTWARFRHAVLVHLRAEGAHSLGDLVADPPEVLGLPLSGQELTAVLESCRRRGLVARLDQGAGSGPLGSEDEWTITDEGRRATRHPVAWLLDHMSPLVKLVGVLLPLAAALGLIKLLDAEDVEASSVLLTATALAMVMGVAIWLYPRLNGSKARRAVAVDWVRWRRERPSLREKAEARFPGKWTLLASVGFVAAVLTAVLFPGLGWWMLPLFLPAYLCWLPLYLWMTRWDEIEMGERDWKRSEAAAEAMEELDARRAARPHAPSDVV